MFSSTEEIIEDIGAGRMVIIVDDEDRENEGDLVMAASRVTASDINYMSLHGRGLICLTVTPEHCSRLRLPLMVADTNICLLYTSPSPRDRTRSRMPSSA